jgi:hypothetical protein
MNIANQITEEILAKYPESSELVGMRKQFEKHFHLKTEGNNKYCLAACRTTSLHYKNVEDGKIKEIESEIQPSSKPNWDWEVVKGHWRMFVKNDATFAIRKNDNWLGFRLEAIAYLDINTKEYHIFRNKQSVTPTLKDNTIRWDNLFPYVNFEIIYDNDKLRERIEVTQTARDNAPNPSMFGLNLDDTYLVLVYQCDWSNAHPAEDKDGLINWDIAKETEDKIWFRPLDNKICVGLPISRAKPEGEIGEIGVVLRKRFFKYNDKHYLLIGAPILDINDFPSGSIIFDSPDVTVSVGADADDGGLYSGAFKTDQEFAQAGNQEIMGSDYSEDGFYRFSSVTIPAGQVIDACTIELYNYITMGTALCKIMADDAANPAAPINAAELAADIANATTAKVDWDGAFGANWNTSPSITSIIAELYASYDYSGGAAVNMLHCDDSSATGADNLHRWYCHNWTDGSRAEKLNIAYHAAAPPTGPGSGMGMSMGLGFGGPSSATLTAKVPHLDPGLGMKRHPRSRVH